MHFSQLMENINDITQKHPPITFHLHHKHAGMYWTNRHRSWYLVPGTIKLCLLTLYFHACYTEFVQFSGGVQDFPVCAAPFSFSVKREVLFVHCSQCYCTKKMRKSTRLEGSECWLVWVMTVFCCWIALWTWLFPWTGQEMFAEL